MLDPTLHHKGFIRVCLSILHSSQKMFTKNTYLIPPSLHPPRSSLVDINGVEILLHHHHPDMFATHYLAPNAPLPALNADPSSSSIPNAPPPRKQAVKKDRHSKIHTAQGPRDRRVRLSIGIARKFFDLQEMLGFDKPSKTLDWLLTKSKEAIKDLVHSKKKSTDVTDKSSSECELLSSAGNGEAYHDNGADSKSRFGGNDPPAPSNLVKESRAKARAKARARTREKMCIKHLNDQTRNNDLNILQNRNNNNQLEFFQLSAAATNNNINVGYPSLAAATDEDLIHESVSIKRKSKNPSFNLGFHQNVVVSRDLSSNYIVPSADHASQNWDVCSFTSQSNDYTILDQHKFINSNSNI